MRVDRGVLLTPVDGQPEPPPQRHERLFVFGGEALAQLDEVRARQQPRRLLARLRRRGFEDEVRRIRQAGIAAHVEVALHATLRGQAVVVPPHRVEDVLPEHAALPKDRKSTRLNSSHVKISYAVFCLKKKKYN